MEANDLERWTKEALAGDADAYANLVRRLAGVVWSVVRDFGLGPADANDAAQATWLRLVENLATIREPRKLPGWVKRTAENECRALLRRKARQVPTDYGDAGAIPVDTRALGVSGTDPSVDARLLAREKRVAVARAFRSLGERCQELLAMLMSDPAPPYAVVSSTLHIPIPSIGPTRARCLDRLRRHPDIVRIS